MESSIQSFIDMCQWDTARFLIVSDNVFGVLIYYSHLIPLLASLVVGVFIFISDRKSLINKILLFILGTFSLWVFLDLILWANEKSSLIMFSWSTMILLEVLIYGASFYFIYVFIYKKDLPEKVKFLVGFLILPVVLLLGTKFNIVGFDLTNCYREVVEGPIATFYIYALEILAVLGIFVLAVHAFIKSKADFRKQIFIISLGIVLFLFTFSGGNIVGSLTENWNLGQFGLIGAPVFIAFLAYMIVRFRAFNIKLIATQVLVAGIWFLLLGILFIRTVENVRIITALTLILFTIIGELLIKSVKREIEQKEELAKLNIELERSIEQRESLVHLVTHKVKGSFTRSKYIFAGLLDGTFGEISPEIKKYAEQGLESDNMGISTVDLVLNADNLQRGIIKYDMQPTDFKPIVQKIAEEKKIPAEAKGLKLLTDIKDGNYHILGDATWLKEAINNLVENSIRYTQKGEINIQLDDGDGKIKFKIKDTGMGITAEDKKNLFTQGGRGKNSVKINVDSTGYGLYSVKLIIEAHKGKVWAESEGEGKGSTFFVELPATS